MHCNHYKKIRFYIISQKSLAFGTALLKYLYFISLSLNVGHFPQTKSQTASKIKLSLYLIKDRRAL